MKALELSETALTAAAHFVHPEFRERFRHEAVKKPARLMARVCHDIGSVFLPECFDRECVIAPETAE